MGEAQQPPAEGHEKMDDDSRFTALAKLFQNEALIESGPSLQFLDPDSLEQQGGSIYYGTGLTTPKAISIGLPFDVLGMMLTAEKVRRAGQFDKVIHHIADTHAATNAWIDHQQVAEAAKRTVATLTGIKDNLGLDAFRIRLSSEFDTSPEYLAMLANYASSTEHEYVRREMTDISWYRQTDDLRLKLGWIIQAQETTIGFDERRFDREYLRFHPKGMSFGYVKPGRTFDTSRPKVSPYISVAGESRLLIEPGQNIEELFAKLSEKDPNLGGAKKHLETIVRLYESLFGSLGKIGHDGVTLASKIQLIIDRCLED